MPMLEAALPIGRWKVLHGLRFWWAQNRLDL